MTAHGLQRIAIKPDPGQSEMFVRVFQRIPSAEATLPAPPMLAPTTIAFTRTGTFIDPTNPQGMSLERVADSYQQLRALDPHAMRTAFATLMQAHGHFMPTIGVDLRSTKISLNWHQPRRIRSSSLANACRLQVSIIGPARIDNWNC